MKIRGPGLEDLKYVLLPMVEMQWRCCYAFPPQEMHLGSIWFLNRSGNTTFESCAPEAAEPRHGVGSFVSLRAIISESQRKLREGGDTGMQSREIAWQCFSRTVCSCERLGTTFLFDEFSPRKGYFTIEASPKGTFVETISKDSRCHKCSKTHPQCHRLFKSSLGKDRDYTTEPVCEQLLHLPKEAHQLFHLWEMWNPTDNGHFLQLLLAGKWDHEPLPNTNTQHNTFWQWRAVQTTLLDLHTQQQGR